MTVVMVLVVAAPGVGASWLALLPLEPIISRLVRRFARRRAAEGV